MKLLHKFHINITDNKILINNDVSTYNLPVMAIHNSNNKIYVAIGNKLINFTDKRILSTHQKSVKSIDSYNDILGCASYDGTATILRSEQFLETVEGPDTEIKSIYIDELYLIFGTRGKTVWILQKEELRHSNNKNESVISYEIKSILSDHTQDVKGAIIHDELLFSWSYDKSIKIYLQNQNEFELLQSISCSETVWNLIFMGDLLIAPLQNGSVEIFHRKSGFYTFKSTINFSVTPLMVSCTVSDKMIALVCNRKVVVFVNSFMNIVDQWISDEEISSMEMQGDCLFVGTVNSQIYVLNIN
ncbi:hypothetical protein NUSPORA_01516 [Nucleospora cyclopteri]